MSTKKRSHERDPFSLSQASWIGFFAKILLCCWFHYFSAFPNFLNLSESRREKAVFVQRHNTSPLLEVPSNGIEVNTARSRHLTRTVYHWSLTLRSFRAKPKLTEDDANGFVKALYQFSHLWILDLLSKNQTLAHAQKRACVPLRAESICPQSTQPVPIPRRALAMTENSHHEINATAPAVFFHTGHTVLQDSTLKLVATISENLHDLQPC